ncbi:MAG: glycosyltransferase [Magnetococcales bacterium]|nr:glycosyltransferase [Magnetococcales bacterium]
MFAPARGLPPILALAPHAWDDRWLSRQQLLSRLAARGWPVWFSFGPLKPWDRGTLLWRSGSWLGGWRSAENGVRVERPARWLLRTPGRPRLERAVLDLHARRLRQAVGEGEVILFLFHPQFEPWIERVAPRWVVYHVYDVFDRMDDWTPALNACQQRLVERADLITAASPGMAACLPAPGCDKARRLPNGADSRLFAEDRSPLPLELAGIPSPRIGYAGTINAKLDLEMIATLAERHPEWSWVFVGPVMLGGGRPRDRLARAAWERALALGNVHWIPSQPRERVPAFVRGMAVNLIPYRTGDDDWVGHGYPVKLHEYLAAGPPVVAGAQEVVKREFSNVAAIAETVEEWEQAIRHALENGGAAAPEQRRAVALANDWEQRADQLDAWLRGMIR